MAFNSASLIPFDLDMFYPVQKNMRQHKGDYHTQPHQQQENGGTEDCSGWYHQRKELTAPGQPGAQHDIHRPARSDWHSWTLTSDRSDGLLNYVLRKAPPFPGGKGVRYSGGDNGQKSADKPI